MSSELEQQAVLCGIDACERLAVRLADLIAQHEHAASMARADWTGPHHDTFEERVAALRHDLEAGRTWVVRLRHEAELRLDELRAQAALLRMTGAR